MATYYTLLTKAGQASIANAVALNQKVNLTYMAVGDGNGNPTTPNENQTALVREKYRATINQLTVDPDNQNYLVAEMIVPTTVGGWSIYEVGVFNDQNQLIAVANFPATYKPELAEGSGRDLIVRIVIQVSNTSVVTLKIDPAITLASQAWVAANYVKKVTVAGGTTGQVLVKKSNANEDFQWVDPTAAVDVNVFSREETQTVATGQTIINLAQLTTDGAAIYIEGIRLRDDQFTVNSPTRLTLATSYPAGTKVTIVQNEETSRNAFTLKANNLSDLTNKSAARTNLGFSAMGIGTNNSPLITTPSTFDWQTYDFKSGESLYVDTGVVANNPDGIQYPPTLGRIFVNVEAARVNSTYEIRVFPSTSANENYRVYAVRITGMPGDRKFVVREELSSAIPVTIEQGGTGATTAAAALVNLGLGDGTGRLIKCQIFNASGTYTPTTGTKFAIVEVVGGGGAGGGCQVGTGSNAACGGGGMSGEYVRARVDNPTATAVTVGAGGVGVSASVGQPGGNSSFGSTILAKGGLGGNVLAEGTSPGVVGPYGAYLTPGFTGANIYGSGSGYNSPGVRYSGVLAVGGPGGDSVLGAGAGAQAIVGEGINANGPGGGGSGACVYGGATQQRAGGAGMKGMVIVWEYA